MKRTPGLQMTLPHEAEEGLIDRALEQAIAPLSFA